jgi:hypothetical protein
MKLPSPNSAFPCVCGGHSLSSSAASDAAVVAIHRRVRRLGLGSQRRSRRIARPLDLLLPPLGAATPRILGRRRWRRASKEATANVKEDAAIWQRILGSSRSCCAISTSWPVVFRSGNSVLPSPSSPPRRGRRHWPHRLRLAILIQVGALPPHPLLPLAHWIEIGSVFQLSFFIKFPSHV